LIPPHSGHSQKHGVRSRRRWRKLHLAVDAETQEIVAVELTPDDVGDVSALPDLLDQIEDPVGSMTADGAYDTVTQFMMRCCSDILQRA
jgi:Transposase DDE domain